MEPVLSRVYDETGLHLTIRSSVLSGNSVSWENGLRIPTAWFLGHKEEAVSAQPVPGIDDRVAVAVWLRAFKGSQFSLPEYSPLPKKQVAPERFHLDGFDEKDVIEIHQKLTTVRGNIELVDLSMYFCHGLGIVRAQGKVIDRTVDCHLVEILDL